MEKSEADVQYENKKKFERRNKLLERVLNAGPEGLTLYLMYYEDRYETLSGDGFYVYFSEASPSFEDMENSARRKRYSEKKDLKSNEGWHYYIFRCKVVFDADAGEMRPEGVEYLKTVDDRYRVPEIAPTIDEIANDMFATF